MSGGSARRLFWSVVVPTICAVVTSNIDTHAQSAHPEPGASFGDDYAPKPAFPEQTRANGPQTPSTVKVEVVAGGLDHPWALAFLPDGRFLVTERPGRLRIISASGSVSEPITGLPAIKAIGTKGLQDIVLDPGFSTNRLVYFCYFAPNPSNPTPDTEEALSVSESALSGSRSRR